MQAEILVDRRRLKRRLSLWRLLAILAAIALIGVAVVTSGDFAATAGFKPHIARVTISGIIGDKREQQELLADIAKARQVKAVVLRINSPGGTAAGGEALFESIRAVSAKKPVVAVFGTVATSAAYLAGIASDHIVARGNSITGSVGIILQWAEVSEMLKKLGIKVEEVRSGPLKATPSPFQPFDEASRELTEEMVADAKDWFLGVVAERRKLDADAVPGLRDGRIYSGRQALKHKLIDQIGAEKDAVSWLEKKRKIDAGLDVVDWKEKDDDSSGLLSLAARAIVGVFGLSQLGIDTILAPADSLRAVQLDGLVSLWHPSND
jgi:protease-4